MSRHAARRLSRSLVHAPTGVPLLPLMPVPRTDEAERPQTNALDRRLRG